MARRTFPVGKLPMELLESITEKLPIHSEDLVLGPGIGFDCAVVDTGHNYQVFTTDPITFTTDELGWYLVQVNANDIATTGAIPRWLMVTLLLPEGETDQQLVEEITDQISDACREKNITVIGGHTEITDSVDRPVAIGAMIGEVEYTKLVTPRGAQPGDQILLTKSLPIEATAILAREFPARLSEFLSDQEISEAQQYLYNPGISVFKDAQIAVQAGNVSAMHDPTEGGLYSALWELSRACQFPVYLSPQKVPVTQLSEKICTAFGIDPMQSIASGALLIAAPAEEAYGIQKELEISGIQCTDIGNIRDGNPGLFQVTAHGEEVIDVPERDEIARIFDQ